VATAGTAGARDRHENRRVEPCCVHDVLAGEPVGANAIRGDRVLAGAYPPRVVRWVGAADHSPPEPPTDSTSVQGSIGHQWNRLRVRTSRTARRKPLVSATIAMSAPSNDSCRRFGARQAGPANERQESLAWVERHAPDHRATAPLTTSILPSEKGEGGPSGPPPQRSTVQPH
jgi:hypothetical protein